MNYLKVIIKREGKKEQIREGEKEKKRIDPWLPNQKKRKRIKPQLSQTIISKEGVKSKVWAS